MKHDIRDLRIGGTQVNGNINIRTTVHEIMIDPVTPRSVGRQQNTDVSGYGTTGWANEPNSLLELAFRDGEPISFDVKLWVDQHTVVLKGWARIVGLKTESRKTDRNEYRHEIDFEVTELEPIRMPDGTEIEYRPVRVI